MSDKRLDRVLDEYVEQGRLTPSLAEEIRSEMVSDRIDVRARLTELAVYVGVGLAVLGVVLIGSQIWSDFTRILRAGIPAVISMALLAGMWFVARTPDGLAIHPVRRRLSAVLGVAGAVLAALAFAVAFERSSGSSDDSFDPTVTAALVVGTLIVLVVSRVAPGAISTLAFAVFLFSAGISVVALLGLDDGPEWVASWMLLLGSSASLVLYRFFPPDWLTRFLGIGVWLLGSVILMATMHEDLLADGWGYFGRVCAGALVIVGTWRFVHGDDWTWAVGAALAAALLVGLWSGEALNAGFALLIAGSVLIAVGAVLFLSRPGRSRHPAT